MGMDIVTKGVHNVIEFLSDDSPDMDVMESLVSSFYNFFSDINKPAAVNCTEGYGTSSSPSVLGDKVDEECAAADPLEISDSLNNRKRCYLLSRNVAGLAGIPKKTAVYPNVPQLLLSSFHPPPEKQKRERERERERESESERGVAATRNGAPAMVSSLMMLPVYPSPSISSSEASWKHNKKFAK
ncbi:hypothetical protein F2Q68_00009495 [Brassica cretica]|uniref:Uncharacterized protein n=1 Tax=Brassica cretica TaxID=69181 RepID=A0A8S9KLC4_BRACR|nr:hypothetical protein F2Q68_00009495 [Brassica cretica]